MKKSACDCAAVLSDQEMVSRIDTVLDDYEKKAGALIPVLQIAQTMFGYLPEPVLRHIGKRLNASYSEVAGVVGFYSFFCTVPRGRHLVRVCLGTACYVRGGKQVLEAFKKHLGIDVGQTTADRMFSLEVARCFGACGLAPTIMIDEEVYQRVKPLKLRAIFDSYRNGGPRPEAKKPAIRKPAAKKTTARKAASKRVKERVVAR